jgi:ATP-dependent DNA helicase RecQ
VAAAREREQQAMRAYAGLTSCRMEFLRRVLDDPDAEPCGRCDNCAGAFLSAAVSPDAVARASAEVRRPGVEVAPRSQWPTALPALGVPLKGRIPATEATLSGRAVGRLTDIGWGPRLRAVAGPEVVDQEVPDDLVRAVTDVLAHWGWDERPALIVPVPSVSHPALVASLAERIGALGRLPVRPALERGRWDDQRGHRSNSAQRVLALHDAFTVPPAAVEWVDDAVVLLVDDYVDTGWTATLAGRVLRNAGARAVLPLALALTT